MSSSGGFRILSVGWPTQLIENLWDRVVANGGFELSHLLHPSYVASDAGPWELRDDFICFRQGHHEKLPAPDTNLLASLERDGVPTIHNMIRSDRIVSKLPYAAALGYATLLARRVESVIESVNPQVVIGALDGLHGSIGLGVAKRLGVPWFSLQFSVIPRGLACLCEGMMPNTQIRLEVISRNAATELAAETLAKFEKKTIQAPAYIDAVSIDLLTRLRKLPRRAGAIFRTLRNSRIRTSVQFTLQPSGYSLPAAFQLLWESAGARRAVRNANLLTTPPNVPYVLFGLHMQPESSIDVLAPFFSDQPWVVELIARSIPPTYRLLVKIHKSDVSSRSAQQLERLAKLPGVSLVAPFADTRSFIERAALVVAIQGTMGLEAALLGRPVIMLGESPTSRFPSARSVGSIKDFPELIRSVLTARAPSREAIVAAYAEFLELYAPTSMNDWTVPIGEQSIVGYTALFRALAVRLASQSSVPN